MVYGSDVAEIGPPALSTLVWTCSIDGKYCAVEELDCGSRGRFTPGGSMRRGPVGDCRIAASSVNGDSATGEDDVTNPPTGWFS